MSGKVLILAASLIAMAPALASDKTDVMAVIHKWGSTSADDIVATCADDASIIDNLPPFEWHGAGACSRWHSDFEAFAKQNGISDPHAVVGKARHIEMSTDRAYVVAPVVFHFKQGGKDMQEAATGTFALQKVAGNWRMTGWTYSPR